MKGNGERLWKELVEEPANPENPAPDDPALNCGPTIKKMKKDWGLEIVENSIMAQDIGYDPDYQQAMQAKSKADLIADGDVQATAGRVIKTVAESAGLTVEQLKIKLSGDPTLRGKSATEGGFKEAFSFAEDIVKRDRAGDLTDLRIGSVDGTPINGDLAGAAAFATLFGRGGGNKGRRNDNRGKDQNSPPQKRPEQMNDEELQEWADEQKKGKKSIV